MRLVTDIDSTVNDHWRRIRRNTLPSWPGTHIDSKAFAREEVMQDTPLPACVDSLQQLQEAGFRISYLSARGWPLAWSITVDWLVAQGFPNHHDVTLVPNLAAKVEVLRCLKPDYYVDDFTTGQERTVPTFHREIAEQIESLGVKVIVFRGDWGDVLAQVRVRGGRL